MAGRKRRSTWSGILGVVATAVMVAPLLYGCARPDEAANASAAGDAPDRSAPDRPTLDRPAERQLAVEVEGMAETIRVVLYRTTPGFPLPFSTYIPEDMIAEPDPVAGSAAADEAEGVRFVANYGGHRNEAAAVRLVVAPAGATEEELVALLQEMARELGTELAEEPDARFGWSIREFRNVAPGTRADVAEGLMAMGSREDRLFALVIHHPAEYGDGFGPRAGVIMDEWRWVPTAEPLRR